MSHQTVSRVINGKEDVSPETRARVMAAIDALGFRPSAVARWMVQRKTHILACISPNLTDYTFASIIEGAEQEARKEGYFLLSASAADPPVFRELVEDLVGHRRVDGLIIINPYADDRFQHIPQDFPLVFVGAHARQTSVCSVALDDEATAYNATRYLLDLGHTSIALITGPMQEDCARDRTEGYKRALQEAGIAIDEALIRHGDWSASSGQAALLSLAGADRLPSAVFAQNDRMAFGVLRAARDLGVHVPSQLSVIGIDDMPLSSYFDPPLTTMRQDTRCIGREAVRLLFSTIQDDGVPCRQLRLSAQLVVRQSTAVPARQDKKGAE